MAARRLGPAAVLNVHRAAAVLVPALGTYFVMHLVLHDLERLSAFRKAGRHQAPDAGAARAPSPFPSAALASKNADLGLRVVRALPLVLFVLTLVLDAVDAAAHATVSTGLLHYHFGVGVHVDHHTLHTLEAASTTAGLMAMAASVLGELLSPPDKDDLNPGDPRGGRRGNHGGTEASSGSGAHSMAAKVATSAAHVGLHGHGMRSSVATSAEKKETKDKDL